MYASETSEICDWRKNSPSSRADWHLGKKKKTKKQSAVRREEGSRLSISRGGFAQICRLRPLFAEMDAIGRIELETLKRDAQCASMGDSIDRISWGEFSPGKFVLVASGPKK